MNHGGHCQDESTSCSGNYVSNLCSGSASRRCCLPSASSGQCSDIGGKCQDDHLYCTGSYVTGKCSGDATNRCCTSHHIGGTDQSICDNIKVISRDTWGATRPTHVTTLNHPVHLFFVHHTEGRTCHNEAECASVLKGVQNYHMNSRDWSDIAYSFLVGEDGHVYEGRGWKTVGSHTLGCNDVSLAASMIGDFNDMLPNAAALSAVKRLITCGVEIARLRTDYSLFGHRDVRDTDCPGNALYKNMSSWTHFHLHGPGCPKLT
ncbi:Peptidoglycan recognition protein 3 [Mizuhopecten yessoensis]|uniref:Peptidoglycan recognition protein 3 n=1 Tax=Mizuhopecten yessoensis TaxID=6573 RepID=A0A210R2F6_MIZYE|nr:Peptidoglycan recognition protein 3 [Mizuhopecten yessoensis]